LANPAVQLKPLAQDDLASETASLLGIEFANFEATIKLPDHGIALGDEDAESGAITNVPEDLAGNIGHHIIS